MVSCQDIVRLYENVMYDDMTSYNISNEAVRIGIDSMAHVYRPETVSLNSNRSVIADYNDPAHRCAYLHKYAAFHTAMVRDVLAEAIEADYGYFRDFFLSENCFRICSLGGGPGSDVIGALAAFHGAFNYFNAAATIVDYMFDWNHSFHSIMKELSCGSYGSFGAQLSNMPWRYYGANLLKTLTPEVSEALGTASLVTMIKFASAAACTDTDRMMKNIFSAMKPGAVVLYIDNSGGGFHNVVKKAADRCNFYSVFGPIMHKSYFNRSTRMVKFGRASCCKSTVTVHMLRKPQYLFPRYQPIYSPCIGNSRPYNHQGMTPIQASPLTPMLYRTDDFSNDEIVNSQSMLYRSNFTEDEVLNNHEFVSPVELPLTPNNLIMPSHIATPLHANIINSPFRTRRVICTPDTQSSIRKNWKRSCLPLKPLNRFRRHLREKMNKFKVKVFRKNIKHKAHPIFNI